MNSPKRLLLAGLWLATTSLLLTRLSPALAQPAPPPGDEQAGDQGADPPALAGRLAALAGDVSFHAAGETQWNAATLNYPVTNGEAFWTQPQASASLEIADDRVVMDEATELDVAALDQSQFVTTVPQGAVFLQLNSLPPGQSVTVNTPRGAVQINAPGRYEIAAGDTNDATTITVVEGAAHVAGADLSLDIGPQQTATISGSTTLEGSVGAMQQDAFLLAQLRVPAPPRAAAAVPQEVQYMTGADDLQRYGSWDTTPEYGAVWYPTNVASDWAPYREGSWSYVQPWGWTWVDREPWGFAPFHYGRWLRVHDRWGWIAGGGGPAYGGYPVYAPALVSFVDVAGVGLGFAAGELAGGYAPAWIPLGPREPYYPWYHTRGDYFARINARYGVPQDIIRRGPIFINNVTFNRTNIFVNRGAATVVPAAVFARGEPVGRFGRPVPERALADARPVYGRLPVRPTAFTPNLPPAAARRFNVALPARPVGRVAPGPRIQAVAHGIPELRRAALPANLHAAPAGREAVAPHGREPGPVPRGEDRALPVVHEPGPRGGLPPLRSPGARPEALQPEQRAPDAADHRGLPEVHRPGAPVMQHVRPEASRAARDGEAHGPDAAPRPIERGPSRTGPGSVNREEQPAPRPEETRKAAHGDEHATPRREDPRPALPHVQEPRMMPRPEAMHPAPIRRPEAAPHPEAAPRPAAAPHQAPHKEGRPEPR